MKLHLPQIFLYAVKSGHDIKHIGFTSCGSPEHAFLQFIKRKGFAKNTTKNPFVIQI